MVHSSVGGLGELDDAGADGVIDTPRGPATTVPMDQGLGAVPTVSLAQAADLTGGKAQEIRRFGHPKLATIQGVEDDELLLCSLRQRDHASPGSMQRGRTFSLNC